MPTYQAECKRCGHQFEYRAMVSRCMETPVCPSCDYAHTKKVILSAPLGFVTGKFDAFVSPVDGSVIRNQRELLAHNDRNQVVNIQDGYDEATVIAGNYCKPDTTDSGKDVVKESIRESIHDLEQGYKPKKAEVIEVLDNGNWN